MTDLAMIRDFPHKFTWGKIINVTDVGAITIVSYREPGKSDKIKISFHVYVDEKDTAYSAASLDEALLVGIARKNLNPDEARYMAMGAAKLLGVTK